MSLCGRWPRAQLTANAQDPLADGEPGGYGEEVDRPLEAAPRREDEPAGDHDHALGAAAEADVALQPEQLRLRAGVRDEEGAGHRGCGERDRDLVAVTREDERRGGQHEA